VVNVLMRPDFDGAESQVTAGVGTAGEPAQARLAQLFGRRWAGGGFVVAYELARRDALHAADRAYSRSADLRPFGGDDFRQTNAFPGNILKTDPLTGGQVPGYAIPLGQSGTTLKPSDFVAGSVNLQNPRVGSDVLPRQTTNSLYVAAHQEVGPVTLLADARYSTRRFSARLEPVISTLSVSRANPFYVSPVGAASEAIAYSWASDLGNPVSQGTVETFGASLSGKAGLFGDWQGQAYGAFDQEIDEVRGAGFINSLILSEALGNVADRPDTPYSPGRDGYFNPFAGTAGSNPTGVLAAIGSGRTWTRSRSRVGVVNVQADGSLLQLPAGALKLALGASARRETYVRTGSNWLSTPAPVPISNPTNAGRTVLAAFAEARVPLVAPDNALPGVERLELSMAGRIEHYALAGTSANPSVGVLWQPTHNLVVRGTFSHSFRAPALREMFDPATVSPTLLARGGVRVRTLTLNGGNPGLDPETARSWTGGLDWTPARWPGLKLSLTAYDVRFSNRIGRPASANLSNALTDPSLAPFVRLISPGTNPADLAAINAALASAPFTSVSGSFPATDYGAIVDLRYVNTTTLHVRGIDASATYAFEAGPRDHVVLSGSGSYMLDYQQQFTPRSAVVDDVNVANFPLRFRGRFTADWTRGRLTLGGAANYTGRYRDSRGERIGDFLDVDLQARLAPAHSGPLKGVAVLLNVRNLFDRDPPFYNSVNGFDAFSGNPIGRIVSVGARKRF
jgi:outer membrane receptor protein involved in Fe transport